MLDFHVHIARIPYSKETSEELVRLGYEAVIVACEPWEWNASEALFPLWKNSAIPCFGIHPMIAEKASAENFKELCGYLQKYPSAFVGECGLDKRFAGYEPGGIQEEIFRKQAEIAKDFNRPLMIHSVGDARRILAILEELHFESESAYPIFHRFNGDLEIVKRALKLGAKFSIHADSFRKASTRAALKFIPTENLRFETDADESFANTLSDAEKSSPKSVANALINLYEKTARAMSPSGL